jgi:hypothetical protein
MVGLNLAYLQNLLFDRDGLGFKMLISRASTSASLCVVTAASMLLLLLLLHLLVGLKPALDAGCQRGGRLCVLRRKSGA